MRSGSVGSSVIASRFEIITISCFIAVMMSALPIAWNFCALNSHSTELPNKNRILEMSLTANGKQMWIQRGLSQLVSRDLTTQQETVVLTRKELPLRLWRVSRDGSMFLIATDDRRLLIYQNHEVVVEEEFAEGRPLLAALSADGSVAVRISSEHELRCWDFSTADPSMVDVRLQGAAIRLGLSPDGKRFAVSNRQGTISIYDLKTTQCLATIECGGLLKTAPVFSDDSRWLAVICGRTVALHDASSGEKLWSISTDDLGGYHGVSFSSDTRWLAITGTFSGTRILDVTSGACRQEIALPPFMHRIDFSPSNDRLYMTVADDSIVEWSLADGQLYPIGVRHRASKSFPEVVTENVVVTK
jgi:WD40 repeat protein